MEVGDKVRLKHNAGPFRAGDTGTVVREGAAFDLRLKMDGAALDAVDGHRGYPRDFHLAVDEDEVYPLDAEERFEEGDRVQVHEDVDRLGGQAGTVTFVHRSSVSVQLDSRYYALAFRRHELESVEEPSTFEVGDRVRVKPGGAYDVSFDNAVGVVAGDSLDSKYDYRVNFPEGGDVHASDASFLASELERVVDSEVLARAVTVNISPDRAEELASELRTLAAELEEAAI